MTSLCLSGALCYEFVRCDKCVCDTDSFQTRFPNRFLCVFCTFLRHFRRVPTHMQPESVSCSSPLACSSRLAHDLCTTVLSSTASLPMPRFGWNQSVTKHCRTRQASWKAWQTSIKNEQLLEVLLRMCLGGCVRFQLRTSEELVPYHLKPIIHIPSLYAQSSSLL